MIRLQSSSFLLLPRRRIIWSSVVVDDADVSGASRSPGSASCWCPASMSACPLQPDETQPGNHNVDAPPCVPLTVPVVTPWALNCHLKTFLQVDSCTNPPITSQFDLIWLFTSSAPTYLRSSWFYSRSIFVVFFFTPINLFYPRVPEVAITSLNGVSDTPGSGGEMKMAPFQQESPGGFTSS